ncbi:hypothetical protein [Isoptericola sp. BMS4]|uniref:hypothetical protein n=1 Tax=Isoptericola sp. BMS4 TaxID=2527875 RepID=UPI00141ECCB5|nr:hypothetical protein [Isoptericola sp. BMS4]
MAPRTIEVTRAELEGRRADILVSLGTGLDDFRERVARGSLAGFEWDAVEELEEIAFLLGETADDF